MHEQTMVRVLAFLMTVLVITAMLLPFVLAAHFGEGWLALNYVTVPGYLGMCAWGESRHGRGG